MLRLIFLFLMLIAVYIWSDWRNWRSYYPTILFVMMGDYLYNVLTYDHGMWVLHSFFGGHIINTLLLNFTLLPFTVLLFLTYFPYNSSLIKKSVFIIGCVGIYCAIEYIQFRVGAITYNNGWSLGWTAVFNTMMFSAIAIHHKQPLLAWPIAIGGATFFFLVLDIPISCWK